MCRQNGRSDDNARTMTQIRLLDRLAASFLALTQTDAKPSYIRKQGLHPLPP